MGGNCLGGWDGNLRTLVGDIGHRDIAVHVTTHGDTASAGGDAVILGNGARAFLCAISIIFHRCHSSRDGQGEEFHSLLQVSSSAQVVVPGRIMDQD